MESDLDSACCNSNSNSRVCLALLVFYKITHKSAGEGAEMKPEEKKLIFDYCGWQILWNSIGMAGEQNHTLDGNDLLEAVQIMGERGDYTLFNGFVMNRWMEDTSSSHCFLFIIQNFFPLMISWLKEK